MIIASAVPTSFLASHITVLLAALISAPATDVPSIQKNNVPILEVVKVYGRLAGPQCYGKTAPPGSSCQIQIQDFKQELGLLGGNAGISISREDFQTALNSLEFQWPLKPYGVDKSLSKTAVMNKGAETRVFMDELERRGIYDRRNPTGPLPTSLRPQLNQQLQREGMDAAAVNLIFDAFTGDGGKKTTTTDLFSEKQIDQIFQGRDEIDYYDFLKIVGTDSIVWPN